MDNWEKFECVMPHSARVLLEDELERIRNLADIDPDDRFSQQVRDGLALELMCANSQEIGDEEVT